MCDVVLVCVFVVKVCGWFVCVWFVGVVCGSRSCVVCMGFCLISDPRAWFGLSFCPCDW